MFFPHFLPLFQASQRFNFCWWRCDATAENLITHVSFSKYLTRFYVVFFFSSLIPFQCDKCYFKWIGFRPPSTQSLARKASESATGSMSNAYMKIFYYCFFFFLFFNVVRTFVHGFPFVYICRSSYFIFCSISFALCVHLSLSIRALSSLLSVWTKLGLI